MLHKIRGFLPVLFFVGSTVALLAQFSPSAAAEPRASLSADDCYAPAAPTLTVGVKRLLRTKNLLKSSPLAHSILPDFDISSAAYKISLDHSLSKYDVHQYMNVYRV
jgi:hypothetical protein